jgi:hypothetical protein
MYTGMRNHEHYRDPTAGLALRAVMRKERRKRRAPSVYKSLECINNPLRDGIELIIGNIPDQIKHKENGGV